MNKLHKVFTLTFSDIKLDCYISDSTATADVLWLSRETIGKLLGYEQPIQDIKEIHSRRKFILDELSIKENGTVYYDFRALIDICYASNSKDKDDVAKNLWCIVDGILALRRVIDSLDETEAKEFIAGIPDELTFREFLMLCLKGAGYLDAK